ncbi:MAG: quinoprotein relay system zinc metallohydrolase 2 [Rhizobiales bacterium]|nr:quinoprotein relay system zinc metallohydrolase 2 [Hyphomicrobiales bacterium]
MTCRFSAAILAIWLKARLVVACFLLLLPGTTVYGQPGAPLTVVEVGHGIFVASGAVAIADTDNLGHIANIGFIVGSKYVAVVDTGGSIQVGRQLKQAIEATTDLPIKFVINTHMHPDHVLGNAAFAGDGVQIVGHHKLASALDARAATYIDANRNLIGDNAFNGTKVITPQLQVSTPTILDLGERSIRLVAYGTAHTDNDLIVIDQKTNTAWLGDLLFRAHLPVIDGSLNGWLDVLEKLGAEKFAMVVPGHGRVARNWPEVLDPQLEYLRYLQINVRRFISEGRTLAAALADIPAPSHVTWELVDQFHRRNISAAFAELEWE